MKKAVLLIFGIVVTCWLQAQTMITLYNKSRSWKFCYGTQDGAGPGSLMLISVLIWLCYFPACFIIAFAQNSPSFSAPAALGCR